jgi:phage terminase large subunit GpA-like protein
VPDPGRQPTVDDAKGYSKEEIAPMLRDCPVLAAIIFDDAEETGPKDSGNTILHKRFPGGVLSMVGANSGAGFRRVSARS